MPPTQQQQSRFARPAAAAGPAGSERTARLCALGTLRVFLSSVPGTGCALPRGQHSQTRLEAVDRCLPFFLLPDSQTKSSKQPTFRLHSAYLENGWRRTTRRITSISASLDGRRQPQGPRPELNLLESGLPTSAAPFCLQGGPYNQVQVPVMGAGETERCPDGPRCRRQVTVLLPSRASGPVLGERMWG